MKKAIRPISSSTGIVLLSRTTEQHSLSMDARPCTCDVGCLEWGGYKIEGGTWIKNSPCAGQLTFIL